MMEAIILGAGPAGLATAACFERAGIPYVQLEQSEQVGSSWRRHYDRLHLHTVKRFSSLPYMPFPSDYPRYVPRLRFVEYLERYAERFALRPRFGETVRSARYERGGWTVTSDQGEHRARRLIVATGYNRRPKIPTFPGRGRLLEQMIHSSSYRTGAAYHGRRVLVVGMGNSGAEIALDLVEQGAAEVGLSVRSPTHVLPREYRGIPSQWTGMMLSKLPIRVTDAMAVAVSRDAFGDLTRYGIVRPDIGPLSQVLERGRIPVLDVGTIQAVKDGRITVYRSIHGIDDDVVRFTDGTTRTFDAVVVATGYTAALDGILECAEQVVDHRGYPRVHGAESSMPGLYFLGYRNPPTGQLFDISREARRITRSIVRAVR